MVLDVVIQLTLCGPAHEMLVLIANSQRPLINSHVDVSESSYPCLVYTSSEGSGESAHLPLCSTMQ